MPGYFFLNIVLFTMGMTLCVMGSVYVLLGAKVDRQLDRTFLIVAVSLILFGLSALGRQYFNGKEGHGVYILMNIMCYAEFFLSFLLVFVASRYLYSLFGPGYRKLISAAHLLMLLHAAALLVSVFTGHFYVISEANVYSRGPAYAMCYIPTIILMVVDFYLLIFRWKERRRERFAFIVYLLLPLASVMTQIAIPGINFGFLAGSLALFFLYFNVLSSRKHQYHIKEKENEKIKLDMLMAQIQPHFLFNSLSVIKTIGRKSPEQAEQAISDFADYLRYNMNSLSGDQIISFDKELEHVRQYMNLQKLRFGDDLQVRYELECTDFKVPMLSVQTLIENAVTHGIRHSESGKGTVTISTVEKADCVEIGIRDDGAGFERVIDDIAGETEVGSRVGIRNTRARIQEMAGGKLHIVSAPGKGTTATIILPKGVK